MALSFKESKRMTDESPVMTMEATMEDARPVVDYDEDITTFDTGDQNFTRSGNYTWYDTFSDNDFSTVDTNKEITLSPTQVNITQENNSQVIPFEMPRYYDGVDLMGMTIQIHYVNANNAENYAAPINVSYSDDKIRFYWMVSDYATVKDGVLKFEIMATGAITVPSSGESKNYLWRTKPNEKLNVLKSLTGTAMNDPTGDDWYTQFLSTMSQKVGEAQTAATLAAQSAKDAQAVVDGLADTLANYYTKEEVNGFITLLQGDIAKVDGLAKFDVQYDTETQTIKFLNGDKLIKTITLNTDPSAEWVTAFNKTVDAKIDENVSVVKTELTEYKTSNDAAVKNLQDSVGNLPETLQSDYYNKQATNKLLESKAEKASVETVSNDLTVVKNTASGLQNSIDTINSDISDIQEQLKNVKPDPNAGREYDITYEDFWQKIKAKLADKVDKVDGKGLSTNDFSAAYKAKLDGIANGANNYSHPTSSGNKHIPAGGSAGQILRWSSDGTAQWGNDNNTTYSAFKGATSSAAGGSGLVPAPAATNATQYLRGDGTWATPPDTKYNNASTSSAGLMSSGDKAKLDGIAANANNYAHPTSAGNKHIPAGGSAGQILRWSADGTAQWGNDNNTTYSDMKGATTEAAGVHGLAPAPAAGAANRYLRSDGTWQVPPDTNTTYGTFKAATASAAGGSGLVPAPAAGKQGQYLRGDGTWSTPTNTTYSDATQSIHGLMSTSDKKKLDGFGAANTYALKSDITAMYRYKGSVASTDKLPTSGQTIGDVYDVGNGMNYAWNGSKWDALGEIFTITKITNTEIDNVLAS